MADRPMSAFSDEPTLDGYIAKLEKRSEISPETKAAFCSLRAQRIELASHQDFIREGDAVDRCSFVEEGLVSRYKTMRDGGRQILSFHLPGDMIDLHASLLLVADHGVRTHVPTSILTVAASDILALAADYPELARAFWFDTLVDAAIFREWTLNVGRRSARQQVAHLLMELAHRYNEIGEGDGRRFPLQLIQADIADATGLSAVHVNRSLQYMRGERLIRTQGRMVEIEDREGLARLAEFDDRYLHPEGPRQHPRID